MRSDRKLFAVAIGIALGGGSLLWAASPAGELTDSSTGKKPYTILARVPRAGQERDSWGSPNSSAQGKSPTVILSDGPPPRSQRTASAGDAGFFYLYADYNVRANHFKPTGFMGDYKDVHVDEKNTEDPADGPTCIKITYVPSSGDRDGWAGLYWIDPKTNWGYQPGGYNLSRRKQLTFWARGTKGGEQIARFKVGGISGPHGDSGSVAIGPVVLTKEWQHYVIDLRDVDLSQVSGGFAWSTSGADNAGPLVFYLDEIRYE